MNELDALFRVVLEGPAAEPNPRSPDLSDARGPLRAVCTQSGPVYRRHESRVGLSSQVTIEQREYCLGWQHIPARSIPVLAGGLLTLAATPDRFRCPHPRDVNLGDYIYQTGGDWVGTWWRVTSIPRVFTRRARVMVFDVERQLVADRQVAAVFPTVGGVTGG